MLRSWEDNRRSGRASSRLMAMSNPPPQSYSCSLVAPSHSAGNIALHVSSKAGTHNVATVVTILYTSVLPGREWLTGPCGMHAPGVQSSPRRKLFSAGIETRVRRRRRHGAHDHEDSSCSSARPAT